MKIKLRVDGGDLNVEYLGFGDQSTSDSLFATCDLFIGPIENRLGAKMKIMQCAAAGTPMLATAGALSAIEYKDIIPQIDLERPAEAAKAAALLLGNEAELEKLSQSIVDEHQKRLASRDAVWRDLLRATISTHRERSRFTAFLFRAGAFLSSRLHTFRPGQRRIEVCVEEPYGIRVSGMYFPEVFKDFQADGLLRLRKYQLG